MHKHAHLSLILHALRDSIKTLIIFAKLVVLDAFLAFQTQVLETRVPFVLNVQISLIGIFPTQGSVKALIVQFLMPLFLKEDADNALNSA